MTRQADLKNTFLPSEKELYRDLKLCKEYRSALGFLKSEKNDAYVGLYYDFYYLREHANYYAEVDVLGPILVSFAADSLLYHVLIRSSIGFKNFRFRRDLICEMEDKIGFVLKLSLDQYFAEIYSEKWKSRTKEPSQTGLLPSIGIFGLFSVNFYAKKYLSNSLPDKLTETAVISEPFPDLLPTRTLEKIKTQVLSLQERLSSLSIVKQLLEIKGRHSIEIARLDEFENDGGVLIDVISEEEVDHRMLGRYFGKKVDTKAKQIVHSKRKVSEISEADIDALETRHKDSSEKNRLVEEFIVTEVNYFLKLKAFYEKSVVPARTRMQGQNNVSGLSFLNLVFEGFVGVFEFTKSTMEDIATVITDFEEEMGDFVPKVEREISFLPRKKHKKCSSASFTLLDRIFLLFGQKIPEMQCYKNFCRDSDEKLGILLQPETLAKLGLCKHEMGGEGSIRRIFSMPIQRLCRYHMILKNLLSFLPAESIVFKEAKAQVLALRCFIKEINDERSMFESLKTTLILQKVVSGYNINICPSKRRFEGKCDCISPKRHENLTLVLFSDMLLVLVRRGEPMEVRQVKREKAYRLIKAVPLLSISMQNIGASRFRILIEEGCGTFVRTPGSKVQKSGKGSISEIVTLTAHQNHEKSFFLNIFSMLKNNIELSDRGGSLFLHDKQNRMLFRVWKKDDFFAREKYGEAVISCVDDPRVDRMFSESQSFLCGKLDFDVKLHLKSHKKFSFTYGNDICKKSLEKNFSNILYNAIELHRRTPQISDSFVYAFRESLEDISSSFTYEDRKSSFRHIKDGNIFFQALVDEKIIFILKSIETELNLLKRENLLISREERVKEEDTGSLSPPSSVFLSNRDSLTTDTCVDQKSALHRRYKSPVLCDSLYQKENSKEILSLYKRICKKSRLNRNFLAEIGVSGLTALVVFWLRKSIYMFFSDESLSIFQDCMEEGVENNYEKVVSLVCCAHRDTFKNLIMHIAEIAPIVDSFCLFRLCEVLLPADCQKAHKALACLKKAVQHIGSRCLSKKKKSSAEKGFS